MLFVAVASLITVLATVQSRWTGTLTRSGVQAQQFSVETTALEASDLWIVSDSEKRRARTSDMELAGTRLWFNVTLRVPLRCSLDAVPALGYDGKCTEHGGTEVRMSIRPPRPGMLFPAHEVMIARSAAPQHLAAGAGVYVYGVSGYTLVTPSTNGFVCIVERPRVVDAWPICFNVEAGRTVLMGELLRGRLRSAGVAEAAIDDSISAKYRDGVFQTPLEPAIGHMLSPYAWTADTTSGRAVYLPLHVHVYLPYATPASLGIDEKAAAHEVRSRGFRVERAGRPDASLIIRTARDSVRHP